MACNHPGAFNHFPHSKHQGDIMTTTFPTTAQTTTLSPIITLMKDTITLAKRSLLKLKHNPGALVDVVLLPIIFMIMFTYLFGGAVAGSATKYLATVVPGVVAFALLMASSNSGTQLREDIETGVFDRFKSLPIARMAPLTGMLTADIIRYAIASLFAVAAGYIMGWRPQAGFGWVLLANLLVIFVMWCVSWVFALIGVLVKSSGTISALSTLTTMVLGFVSNAIVPIDTLPAVLRAFARINPVTYLVDAYRVMVTQGILGDEALAALLAGGMTLMVFIPLTAIFYHKKI
jgi:ABC-2 type transport system permease protein